jgi:hypothetical protein
MMEPNARQADLLGSFALLAASAIFTIPYERVKAHHILARPAEDVPLYQALKVLEGRPFLSSELWRDANPGEWNYLRVQPSSEHAWMNFPSVTPISEVLDDTMSERSTGEVLRVIRNALAHGNVIYLNKERREVAGQRAYYLAFLSHYRETREEQERDRTFRMVITSEEDFLRFVKGWARWLQQFPETEIVDAA